MTLSKLDPVVILRIVAAYQAGATQEQIGLATGLSTSQVGNVLRGDVRPEVARAKIAIGKGRYHSNGKAQTRHGGTRTPEYRCWQGMKARCLNRNHESYPYYGGRGITFCDRWLSFPNFLEDMGPRPPGHSIEREDVNGNYEPSNCHWGTRLEQSNNKRASRRIRIGDENLTVAQWASRMGVSSNMICHRLSRGWSEKEAVMSPRKIER